MKVISHFSEPLLLRPLLPLPQHHIARESVTEQSDGIVTPQRQAPILLALRTLLWFHLHCFSAFKQTDDDDVGEGKQTHHQGATLIEWVEWMWVDYFF